ncbi:uncharacterized protein MONBRDRAFT_22888 [Monosiga brevicollis MX1]|uniref:RNA helicase n=1 Tax=Monosiga brevicollis TaxID=81824 RepID=A9USD2_MONBE|nr:uncharacterized protein MONBRDRAFT_22888 [Monosiga brevicollis MX1]EDQ91760.1 predicted protein [Monosiga brevicollis MX1]|eukprot:XP_001743046.1 hypothetical protein [Monosiga brevicollis MX1]
MGRRKQGRHIQNSGNAGNSKKASKDEVKQLQATLKKQADERREAVEAAKAEKADEDVNQMLTLLPMLLQPAALPSDCDLTKWTGKTPSQLLYDHCRKKKWLKPGFSIKSAKGGSVVTVFLNREDEKTKERKTIVCKDPRIYVDSTEAKNFGAVYALHRVAYDLQINLVLPPGYRDYWKQLEAERKEHPTRGKTSCPTDPFTVQEDHERERQARDAERKRRQRAKELNPKYQHETVIMEDAHRQDAEEAIKSCMVYASTFGIGGTRTSGKDQTILPSLCRKGFLKAHVKEAMQYTHTEKEAQSWLLLHLPERDLPKQFQHVHSGVSVGSSTQAELSRIYKADKLAEYGFAHHVIVQELERNGDNVFAALVTLVMDLLDQKDASSYLTPAEDEARHRDCLEIRKSEREVLSSVNPDAFQSNVEEGCCWLQIAVDIEGLAEPITMVVLYDQRSAYPHSPPLVLAIFELQMEIQDALPKLLANPPPLASLHLQKDKDAAAGPVSVRLGQKLGEEDLLAASAADRQGKKGRSKGSAMPALRDNTGVNAKLQASETALVAKNAYQKMLGKRQKLPSYKERAEILRLTVIIAGETGCGKTTQVPQFILEDLLASGNGSACHIYCTQPRRLSAIAIAQRVSDERTESVGSTVGYSVRLERKASAATRLTFCTTGILLRQLQSDKSLAHISHVVVDEVHERSLDSDVLLALLKDVLRSRRDLKVILMSATLDADKFSRYFGGAPVLNIPGFTHPVSELYLEDLIELTGYQPNLSSLKKVPADDPTLKATLEERAQYRRSTISADPYQSLDNWESIDEESKTSAHLVDDERFQVYQQLSISDEISYRMVAAVVDHICASDSDDGAILVFMPGMYEIRRTMRALSECSASASLHVLPLHSSLTPQEQNRIFQRAPKGSRKVVVSTNVAETSITIDDVTHVIDAGKLKENQFLGTFLDAPQGQSVEASLDALRDISALSANGKLTALGAHLAQLPIDVRLGKMLIFGAMLRCVDPVLTVAAAMGYKSFFVAPMAERDAARAAHQKFYKERSDHLMFAEAFNEYQKMAQVGRGAAHAFCETNFLSRNVLSEVKDLRLQARPSCLMLRVHLYSGPQYYGVLQEMGFVPALERNHRGPLGGDQLNANAEQYNVVKAVLAAGLYPNVIRIVLPQATFTKVEGGAVQNAHNSKDIRFFPKEPGRVFLHPSSALFLENSYDHEYAVYFDKGSSHAGKTFVREVTVISPYALMLFGGKLASHAESNMITVDDWIKFKSSPRVAVLIDNLRDGLDQLLRVKLQNPGEPIDDHALLRCIDRLLQTDGRRF